jgi:uncharacterized protein (TIGR02594 family)
MDYDRLTIQKALRAKGFTGRNGKPLSLDGIWGPNSKHALIQFKKSVGLRARDYVGPITWGMLTGDRKDVKTALPDQKQNPTWYNELLALMGKHERDKEVAAWLKSDGSTVGDPSKIPWCGDAVETAIKLALPDEAVPDNPYLAANWAKWGKPVQPQRGAVLSFWRGSPTSWKGHVGFYAGESDKHYYVLGGNQSNSVTIAPIDKNRLRRNGSRWPLHGGRAPGHTFRMSGGTVSHNEA